MFGTSPGDATSYINIINQSKKPFLTVLGNHDEWVYENTNISINTAVSNYINLTNDKLCYEPRGYGYKDFDTYKIRLIILNSFDYPDIKDINDKYIYYCSYCMYLENQISWLISTLTSTPNDYTVIIASHYVEPCIIDETKIAVHKETKHRSDSGANAGGLGIMSDTIISDIIDAYKNKTILSKNYTYNNAKYNIINGITNDININADFSSSSGKFACYICGHVHNQQIGVISNHTDQVVYFNDSSRNIENDSWTTAYSIIPKTKSGKSQNLMTVLCVDTDNKNLNFIRIGAYLSIYMEDYSFLNYKYSENL